MEPVEYSERKVPMIKVEPGTFTGMEPEDVYYFIEWVDAAEYDIYTDQGYVHAKFFFMNMEGEWGKLRRNLEKEMILHQLSTIANKPPES